MRTAWRWVAGLALYLLLFVGATTLISSPEVLRGDRLWDTDDYTRVLRVEALLESGRWFDGTIPRSNWPDGETLHWTRPMDAALVAGTWLAAPIVGRADALQLAAVVVPSILLLLTIAATTWAAAGVSRGLAWGVTPLFLLVQPGLMFYGRPGRPDHHVMVQLAFAVALAFFVRVLTEPNRRRWSAGLGVSCAFGVWVSPEFLLPLGLFLLAGVGSWIRRGGRTGPSNLAWVGSFALCLVFFLIVERGAGLWAVEYDRVSVVHGVMAGLAVGVWIALTAWEGRRSAPSAGTRLVAAAGVGVLALAAMAVLFPPFFGGPMVDVTDPVAVRWLGRVAELQPTLFPGDLRRAGLFLMNGGAALLLIPMLMWSAGRARGVDDDLQLALAAGMAVCLGLALFQFRWIIYVQIFSGVAAAIAVSRAGVRTGLTRGLLAGSLIVGPLALGMTVRGVAGSQASDDLGLAGQCDAEALAAYLSDDPRLGAMPMTVAAHMDLGPVLLYRTPHRVLATPYHRNDEGIRKVYDLFAATEDRDARTLVAASRIDLIVVCPSKDRAFFPVEAETEPTLLGRLMEGDPPDWLRSVPLAASLQPFRLYEVR